MRQVYPALTPKDASSMALGGCFTSIPTAQFSFFGNPSGFAAPKSSVTLLSADTWAYVKPTVSNIRSFVDAVSSTNPLAGLAGLMPGNGGIGGGASVGIGYAGKGLGLGVFVTSDDFAAGNSILGANVFSDTEVSGIIGLGIPLKIFGTTLSIGGDFRPFYRVRSEKSLADIMSSLGSQSGSGSQVSVLDGIEVNAGFGLAVDLGASLQLGELRHRGRSAGYFALIPRVDGFAPGPAGFSRPKFAASDERRIEQRDLRAEHHRRLVLETSSLARPDRSFFVP